ncbi:MAG: hypothetical protein EOP84_27955 [Verrucomicrobiaceae bacterium]|nr:MAG: hypothetical protein EOP84_27955 [Verrucomicrobiaceae bacterium]
MNPPIKLVGAVVLAFAALTVAFWIEFGSEILWLAAPPFLAFVGIYTVLLRSLYSGRLLRWPFKFWGAVITVSLLSWIIFFGSVVPSQSYTSGIDDHLPELKTFLEQPLQIHRLYFWFFRSVLDGDAGSVASGAIIILSVLLPILIACSVVQIWRVRRYAKSV